MHHRPDHVWCNDAVGQHATHAFGTQLGDELVLKTVLVMCQKRLDQQVGMSVRCASRILPGNMQESLHAWWSIVRSPSVRAWARRGAQQHNESVTTVKCIHRTTFFSRHRCAAPGGLGVLV